MAERQTLHAVLDAIKPMIDTKALARKIIETYVEQEGDDFDDRQGAIDRLAGKIDKSLFDKDEHNQATEELTGAMSRVVVDELGPFFD